MEHNCGFTDGNQWFRYRAAAIIVEDDCVHEELSAIRT